MSELTEAAKAEIAEAIRIVREDRFEKYARTALGKHTPPPTVEPPVDELIKPDEVKADKKTPTDPVNPPPKKEEPEVIEPSKKKSAYWGEILSD